MRRIRSCTDIASQCLPLPIESFDRAQIVRWQLFPRRWKSSWSVLRSAEAHMYLAAKIDVLYWTQDDPLQAFSDYRFAPAATTEFRVLSLAALLQQDLQILHICS